MYIVKLILSFKSAIPCDLCSVCGTFSHRDLIPIVAALEYNQWFTKLSSKDLKLVSIRVKGERFMILRAYSY